MLRLLFLFPLLPKGLLEQQKQRENVSIRRKRQDAVDVQSKQTDTKEKLKFFLFTFSFASYKDLAFQKSVHGLSQLCPIWISRSDCFIFLFFFLPYTWNVLCIQLMGRNSLQDHTDNESTFASCLYWYYQKRLVNRKEKAASKSTSGTTRKHLWQLHPSNCCYRNFSYLYSHYDLDFS